MNGLRERKKERTREAILEAAHDLFVKQGFAVTTMEQVAARAEVSVGTLYNYFASKNALLLSLAGSLTDHLLERGRTILDDPPDDPLEALGALLEVFLDFPEHFPKPVVREMFASFFTERDLGEGLMELDYHFIAQSTELVVSLQAKRQIVDTRPASELAMTLYATVMIPTFMFAVIEEMSGDALRDMARRQLETVFKGLQPR